ncbi:type VI secretion system protein ImpL [Chitinimonas taiwanensis DSM 18899]|uniref:Type VI secretion system protein ImpL n=1 Tax=Chitinimonas taiwanensis DSM 18899 TaxID=1121279 RepID=A0A1K2HDW5_9NEIS|nr:type VI secretion system protein ImpL [Chitinimonas taiwanensis DSM 18899]
MNRLASFFRDLRVISLLAVLLSSALLYGLFALFDWALVLPSIVLILGLAGWAVYWLMRRHRAAQAGEQLNVMLAAQGAAAANAAPDASKNEVDRLRGRLQDAIKTICTSKLGETSGRAALYELPWYMIIGNPAAGKSSAIKSSGLRFPFAEQGGAAVQGVGGTRNCDWFFTTEGILLDTAGRYSVHEEDRNEWFGFLSLLRKYRPKAPINGILIAVSISELSQNRPEHAIQLAKNLRQRVQELTEKLEVFPPVYVVFTKMDLLAGFTDFFEASDEQERHQVWGATLPYQADAPVDAVAQFDNQFEVLSEGLKDLSAVRMSMQHKQAMSPGLLTFPMEFMAIRPALRTFVATLFEDNPFQFKPVFRGFYFTSALQEGRAVSPLTERMASRFDLQVSGEERDQRFNASHGFFLKDLFSKVIFADKGLVRQYASRRKQQIRYASFFAGVAVLGLLLAGWTTSYLGNQKLVANVRADLEKVVRLQEGHTDLAVRLEAMEILQDRIIQLSKYREDKPLSLGFGLYKGDELEAKLRREYFHGVQQLMLKPVASNLESFLNDVNAQAGSLQEQSAKPMQVAAKAPAANQPYKDASPSNVDDGYNALKTYIMLANRDRLDPGHLNDQITRFWRGWLESRRGSMSREALIRSAEKLLTYTLSQTAAPDFPLIDNQLALVDQSRETLRRVVKGMPARERVYAEIKMRAAARFPAMTVASIVGEENKAIVAGSYVVPGAFTRAAWEGYVQEAIKEAANKETQASDWVLKTEVREDLTLEGSPEQIQKSLTAMYKNDYVVEWQKFVQSVTVAEFQDFSQAVGNMNRLGDPALSPLNKLMEALYNETSWDNPSLVDSGLKHAKRGFIQWFKEVILRRAPSGTVPNSAMASSSNNGQVEALPMGPIGREFAVVGHLMRARGEAKDQSLMRGYLDLLGKLRSRFNQIKNAGDIGPGSTALMRQTLDGNGSELAEALKYVDEQMLNGVTDSAKATMRPMLVRPLMQSFAVLLKPSEAEINRTWTAQVYEPYSRTLAGKYPFAAGSKVEASAQEIGAIFGPDGAIAKFTEKAIGPLAVRRGDMLSARTWADMGVQFSPAFVADFPRYVAAQGGAAGAGGGAAAPAANQTQFQIMPMSAPGLSEYTIEIDGQVLRYRNGMQSWSSFVWPNPSGAPGVKITATTFDGRVVELLNVPGNFGLEKMIGAAQRKKKDQGLFELSWANGNVAVAVNFRIISSPQVDGSGSARQGQGLQGLTLPQTIVGSEFAAPAAAGAGA